MAVAMVAVAVPLNDQLYELVVGCLVVKLKASAVQEGQGLVPLAIRYYLRTPRTSLSQQKFETNFILSVYYSITGLPFQGSLLFRELYNLAVNKHPFALPDAVHISLGNICSVRFFAQIF